MWHKDRTGIKNEPPQVAQSRKIREPVFITVQKQSGVGNIDVFAIYFEQQAFET